MRRRKTWALMLSGLMIFPLGCGIIPVASLPESRDPAQDAALKKPQASQKIDIIGASTPYPAIKLLASAYQSKVGDIQITFLDSSQSSGGIAGVKAGLAEIGTVTRPPKSTEADDNLVHLEIARDALLIATHPSVEGVDDLTTATLQAIYSGEVTNWKMLGGPDAEIVVLDRAEDTSAKRLLRKHYLGSDLKNAPGAIRLRRESDLIEALQNTPYSIGTVSWSRIASGQPPVKSMSLDGIAPTAANLDSGRYAMYRTLGIVWYGTPSETTQGFINFISSETGTNILQQAGFAPALTN